ncbi:hypothetical protein L210DRAFT_3501025 [Boletus edulis BED1]|uniref:Uncharacterized protein n=1 Tax=Boletus edulis BED1 TaxID=1328754 RepID=A0AAD4C313_BOLED|nr:hypothetical protein L210DRAFT_3501025 [Boletus edulis BED1]
MEAFERAMLVLDVVELRRAKLALHVRNTSFLVDLGEATRDKHRCRLGGCSCKRYAFGPMHASVDDDSQFHLTELDWSPELCHRASPTARDSETIDALQALYREEVKQRQVLFAYGSLDPFLGHLKIPTPD